MNADPSRAGAGGEENSWEALAEDLFGINLGADPARDSLVVPEDLSLDEPESPSEAKAAKNTPDSGTGKHETPAAAHSTEKKRSPEIKRPAGRGSQPSRPAPSDEDDFGADLDLDEPESDEPLETEAVIEELEVEEEDFVAAEGAGDEEESRESTAEAGAAPGAKERDAADDSYWDSLKDWQWSEEETESRDRPESGERRGPRGGGGGRGGGQRRSGGRERSGGRDRPPQGGGRPPRRSEGPPQRRREERSEGRRPERQADRPAERQAERPPERPRRQEPPVRPVRSESDEIDDFGAGLLEEQPFSEPARGGADEWDTHAPAQGQRSREESDEGDQAEEGSESVSETGEQTDADRAPRRRRRRRRSRSRKERPGERPGEGPDERQRERPAERPEGGVSVHRTGGEIEDESPTEEAAADESRGETEGEESEGPRRRRRRRRRPTDRGPRREPSDEVPLTESEAEEAFPTEPALESTHVDDEDEEDAEDSSYLEGDTEGEGEGEDDGPRVYRNVPTWEEAIAFLLHKRPGDSRSREGEPRDGRRDGGRRPERGDRPRD